MQFKTPKIKCNNDFISQKITIIKENNHRVIANKYIKSGELIISEYPKINLFGDEDIDKALQVIIKYDQLKENPSIAELYPRNDEYIKSPWIKNIHKIIKNSDKKLQKYFDLLSKEYIEQLYAKYLYNTFEGWEYGPLTLPIIAKLNHSCSPNVQYEFDKSTCVMNVFAIKNIKSGEEIFDSYLSNKNIENHQEYLFQHYGFRCQC
jgi:hypothetical protein